VTSSTAPNGAPKASSVRATGARTNNALRGTVGVGLALGNGKDSTPGDDVESTAININTEWSVEGLEHPGRVLHAHG
jgi:hypothetical protein